ncbi:MAG: hypothetical protein HPZ91_06040 [Lentisphaeria bacterium]|nr:hypothetical protein [Lentisphaeria bacterium]
MKKLMIIGGVAAAALLAVGVLTSLPAQADNSGNSQLFNPGRYALVAAEVNVNSLQQGVSNEQQVVLKIDTVTGKVWVLQLRSAGVNDARIDNATWKQVDEPLSPAQQ